MGDNKVAIALTVDGATQATAALKATSAGLATMADDARRASDVAASAFKALGLRASADIVASARSVRVELNKLSSAGVTDVDLGRAREAARRQIAELRKEYAAFRPALNLELKGAADVGRQVSDLSKTIGTMGHIGIAVAGLPMALSALSTIRDAALAFGQAMVDARISSDKLAASLEFSLGKGAVAKEMGYVSEVANRLGLDLGTTATAYAKLAASAKGTSLEGQNTKAIFESISKATTVMGLSADDSSGALRAISQMMSKGTVSAEELRGQLGERLPGAFNIAAKAMGVTTAELGKMLESGQLLSADFLPRFAAALEASLGDAPDSAAGKAMATMNRLHTATLQFQQSLSASGWGDFFLNRIKGLTERLQDATQAMDAARKQGYGGFLQGAVGISSSLWGFETLREQKDATITSIGEIQSALDRLAVRRQGNGGYLSPMDEENARNLNRQLAELRDNLGELARVGRITLLPSKASMAAEAAGTMEGVGKAFIDRYKQFQSDIGKIDPLASLKKSIEDYRSKYESTIGISNAEEYAAGLAVLQKKLSDKQAELDAPARAAMQARLDAQMAIEKAASDYRIERLKAAHAAGLSSEKDYTRAVLAETTQRLDAELKTQMRAWQDGKDGAAQQKALADMAQNRIAFIKAQEDAEDSLSRAQASAYSEWEKNATSEQNALDDLIKKAREELAQIGLTAEAKDRLAAQIRDTTAARLDDNAALYETIAAEQVSEAGLSVAGERYEMEAKAARAKAAALRELASLETRQAGARVAADATRKAAEDWKRFTDDLERSLTDALMRSFEAGDSFGEAFIKNVRNLLKTAALKVVVQAIVDPIMGAIGGSGGSASGGVGFAQALQGAGTWSVAANAGSMITSLGGKLGSSAISDFGAGMQYGVNGVEVASTASSAGASVATAAPYVAAAIAAYKLAESMGVFGHAGTPHTGGMAQYSLATGLQTDRAASNLTYDFNLNNFDANLTNSAANLAKGITTMLDSTAKAFSQAAGFAVGTGFADDSSRDGAWGALQISRGGQSLIDWRRGADNWPGREFADGSAGQAQYNAAIAADVRRVLDDMDLPAWADSMLNQLGSTPSLDNLTAMVDQINGFAGALGSIDTVFMTDTERLNAAFQQLQLSVPETQANYIDLAKAQDLTTEAGRANYLALVNLAPAWQQLNVAVEEVTDTVRNEARSLADIARERGSLQDQYNSLTMTSAQLRAEERKAIDATNLTLFDSITVILDQRAAAEEAARAQEALADANRAAADAQERLTQAAANAGNAFEAAVRNYQSAVSAVESATQSAAAAYQRFVDNVTQAQAGVAAAGDRIVQAWAGARTASEAAANAVQAERDKITDGYLASTDKVMEAQQRLADLNIDVARSMGKLSSDLRAFLGTLDTTDLGGLSGPEQWANLQTQFDDLLARAQAGEVNAGNQLPGVATSLLGKARDYTSSEVDYARIVAKVRGGISGVADQSDVVAAAAAVVDPITLAQQALTDATKEQARWAEAVKTSGAAFEKTSAGILAGYDAAVTAQTEAGAELARWATIAEGYGLTLDQRGDDLVAQYDAAQTTLAQALADLEAANAIKGDLELRQTTALEAFAAGIEQLNAAVAGLASATIAKASASAGTVEPLYQSILGRKPDAEGAAYWGNELASGGSSLDEVRQSLVDAKPINDAVLAAYKTYAGKTGDQIDDAGMQYWVKQAYAVGIDQMEDDFERTVKAIRGYAKGSNYIARDQLAMVHEGERILPAADNRELMRTLRNPGAANEALVAEVRALRAEMAALRAEQKIQAAAIVRSSKEGVRLWRDVTDNGTSVNTTTIS